MGERGHTVHALGELRDRLGALGGRVAVLGSNERWTSFVPVGSSHFDDARASEILAAPLVHVWFEEDVNLEARFFADGRFVGRLSLDAEDTEVEAANVAVVAPLVELGFVPAAHWSILVDRLNEPDGLGGWTMAHGLEELLGLPYVHPVPLGLPESELLAQLDAAGIVVELVGPSGP